MKINAKLENEIQELNNKYLSIRNVYNDIEENPNKVFFYLDKYPFLFSTIWLLYNELPDERTAVYTQLELKTDISFGCSSHFSKVYISYFYNGELTQDNVNDFYFNFLEDEVYDLIKTFTDCRETSELLTDTADFTYSEADEETETLFLSYEFVHYFVIPIIKGDYDNYLEKLAKQCLLKLSLEERD